MLAAMEPIVFRLLDSFAPADVCGILGVGHFPLRVSPAGAESDDDTDYGVGEAAHTSAGRGGA